MKSLKEILEIIATDAEDYISAQLAMTPLDDFDEYVIGPSRKENNKSLCILIDPEVSVNVTEQRIAVLFYMQMFKTNYTDALLYSDILLDYIKAFDTNLIDMSYIDNISLDIIPIDNNSHTLIYISAIFYNPLDSCDE